MYDKPKKRLGQNFLVDKNIQRKIIEACDIHASDIVLEVGAGKGELTAALARAAKKVFALEIDVDLHGPLKENLKHLPNVEIIKGDVLQFNLNKHLGNRKDKIKVIGNIPYYISSPIIEHLLKYKEKISAIFITVQKEFARRLASPPGSKEYGSFSCFVQYYTVPKILLNINKGCFRPVPKVDSSLVRLSVRLNPAVRVEDEGLFFKLIRSAFSQRRKTLRNSLKGVIPEKQLEELLARHNLDINIRPEMLSLEDFSRLTESAIKNQKKNLTKLKS